jgi:hypothetical protein
VSTVNDPAVGHHLDPIRQAIALYTPDSCQAYDVWRRAYHRGLVTAAELSRFLVLYDRETADTYNPDPISFLNPRRTTHE